MMRKIFSSKFEPELVAMKLHSLHANSQIHIFSLQKKKDLIQKFSKKVKVESEGSKK